MRVAQALLATALVVGVITGAGSAAATPRAQTVKVAFLQGEQVVYLDRSGSTLTSALRALVGGPTNAEQAREVTTQIPSGTTVRAVSIKDRVATVDFSDKIALGSRTESLSARIVQVVLTATRFRNVRFVRIQVKGGTPLGLFPGFVTRYPLTARDVTAPDTPPPGRPASVKPRAPSEATRSLQQALADRGFLTPADVDGRPGPRTTSAIVAFQKWVGLRATESRAQPHAARSMLQAAYADRLRERSSGRSSARPPAHAHRRREPGDPGHRRVERQAGIRDADGLLPGDTQGAALLVGALQGLAAVGELLRRRRGFSRVSGCSADGSVARLRSRAAVGRAVALPANAARDPVTVLGRSR